MTAGHVLIIAALGGSLASLVLFALVARGREGLRDHARNAFTATSILVAAASALLWWLMLSDRFDVRYVHDYSSSAQPPVFKVSGFWGGQEGSWLLWLLFISLAGLALMRRAAHAEGAAMAFWSSVQAFFLIILIQRSPFAPTPVPVEDGMGLNPLLQNYWMAIHPPVIFLGFTLLSVPAAFAFAALVTGDFSRWSRLAHGWALGGWTVLGAGLLLGGVWAYETLGWGGWWGWDPVENSSLVPWLVGGALLHGLMLEKRRAAWRKLNLFLAYAAFVLIIYATFLTRSGVLGDFSVHSFASLGNHHWLAAFLTGYTLLGIGLVALRTRGIEQGEGYDSISSKEFLVFLGIVLFGLAAVLVAIGMSSPLLSAALAGRAGNVPVEYYYRVTTPVALAMMALVGMSPLVAWSRSRRPSRAGRQLLAALGISLALGIAVGVLFWVRSGPEIGARVAVGWFALSILLPNLYTLIDTLRRQGLLASGGHAAHVGLAILFLGMLASSHNNRAEPDRLALTQGKPQEHLGMRWTFSGVRDGEGSSRKQTLELRVERPDGRVLTVSPSLEEVRDGSEMRRPGIRSSLAGDLYVAPVELGVENPPPHAHLERGGKADLGPYRVEFLGFSGMEQKPDGSVQAGARLRVRKRDGTTSHEILAAIRLGQGQPRYLPGRIPGTEDQIVLTQMSVESGGISVLLDGPKWRENAGLQAVLEVTFKPLAWVLWLGAGIIALGGALSTVRRVREALLPEERGGSEALVRQIEEIEALTGPEAAARMV